MKPYVQISLRTKIKTNDWSVGERFVESLFSNGGHLSPEDVSHNPDRFRNCPYDTLSVEGQWAEAAAIRANGRLSDYFLDFAWRRKKPVKCVGCVRHTSSNIRGKIVPGGIMLSSNYSNKVDWSKVFRIWCDIFTPQIGMLHYFTKNELGHGDEYRSFQVGSFRSALSPEVPNAGWMMFYGDDFSEKINFGHLEDAGFYVKNESGGYVVRITDEIQDVANDFPSFSRRREEMKKLFPEKFFLE